MPAFTAKRGRQLLLVLHVLASVGWVAMAVVQLTLLARAFGMDGGDRLVTFETALFLENEILDPFGIVTAYTGLMLSALTPWGYFRHHWVTVKFWLTLVAVLLGSLYLGHTLEGIVEAERGGAAWSATSLVVGTCWTLGSLVLMVWVSIAKPWGRRGARAGRPADWTPPAWVYAAAVVVPVVEYVAKLDYPIMTLAAVIGVAVHRGRRIRAGRPAAAAR
ncbi:hypothetical protein [Pseudonocardia sp. TRM90224]|uniref:hypothetical protein n=1 Tax=Pseudonocardia sp. TRM90224 TaxID=2812678 RepID=UPI001E3996F2|nr:hypothetical protein [Pseudonocardia sp. TRM90224]